MSLKSIYSFIVLIAFTLPALSQKMKVKRKGVQPIDVTKNPSPNTSIYSLNQFNGKWQEVSRTDRNTNTAVAFNDTLFYIFSGENVFSRDGVNMSLRGEAFIDPGNVLVAAADVFTIKSLTNNQAVLDDGDQYLHTLVRKKSFWYETLPTNYVEPEKYTNPIAINSSALIGKWKVYRRDAKPGKENNRILIRILNITTTQGDNIAKGEVTFYLTEKLQTQPCTVTLNGTKMHIVTANDSWSMNVYKADGKDFVFGDNGLMYYCKPL
ncbi:MAG: hypothetical protein M3004_07175 [Bacteroidota bacterium]|nr:hypothetical protein [Bacteroidota bacterium]